MLLAYIHSYQAHGNGQKVCSASTSTFWNAFTLDFTFLLLLSLTLSLQTTQHQLHSIFAIRTILQESVSFEGTNHQSVRALTTMMRDARFTEREANR